MGEFICSVFASAGESICPVFASGGELSNSSVSFASQSVCRHGSTLLSRDDEDLAKLFLLMIYLTNWQVKAFTLLIVSFILVPGSETQVQAVCANPLVGLVHRPDEAADLGEGGRPVPLALPSAIRS